MKGYGLGNTVHSVKVNGSTSKDRYDAMILQRSQLDHLRFSWPLLLAIKVK